VVVGLRQLLPDEPPPPETEPGDPA
jgi:hypothetical protein